MDMVGLGDRAHHYPAQLSGGEQPRTSVLNGRAAVGEARAGAQRIEALLAPARGAAGGKPIAVRAPASGSVLSVITKREGVVPQGTPLMTITDGVAVEPRRQQEKR